jgi:hypothetical protein
VKREVPRLRRVADLNDPHAMPAALTEARHGSKFRLAACLLTREQVKHIQNEFC